jgi:hypothetical protein
MNLDTTALSIVQNRQIVNANYHFHFVINYSLHTLR